MITVEDEVHFLLHCPRHSLLRNQLLSGIQNPQYFDLIDIEKLKFLLNHPDIVKQTAQFVVSSFDNYRVKIHDFDNINLFIFQF